MTRLFANPYDISATGFYFETVEEYADKSKEARNQMGFPIEEFEIEFIDGEEIDCDLFRALRVHQGDISAYLDACDVWTEDQKCRVIIACYNGYGFDFDKSSPDDIEVDIYEVDSMKDLAEQFVEEGLFGEIPESIRYYLDYNLIARDLEADYSTAEIAGTRIIYRLL